LGRTQEAKSTGRDHSDDRRNDVFAGVFRFDQPQRDSGAGPETHLPSSASSQELKPKSKAVITIGLHDTLQVDGTDTPLNGLIASLHKIKKDGELLNVVVNSDRGVEVQRLVDVMDVLKQGGFESIAIATRKP